MIAIKVNGKEYNLDTDPEMPLLWALRDLLDLTGTKYSCGIGQCGACTVHIDGEAKHACTTPLSQAAGKQITTIEGYARESGQHLIDAWVQLNVSQCGYCQPGQIMTAAALLAKHPDPNEQMIIDALAKNICRCGTYPRIRKAIQLATQMKKREGSHD